ncbi:alpha/beta fold hydrolase [Rhizobium grahamii]|uniref:alpha/beta fold hydrolase n=1 Tax=Rhizobium grahamii TaxID=1120045 RepID=UPI0011B05F73|nr:hypothetical protein [Rhizobium grahamii]
MVFAGVIAEIFVVTGSTFARVNAVAIGTGAGPPGGSPKHEGGYDKQTMAGDIKALLDHLGIESPITLVAHDL